MDESELLDEEYEEEQRQARVRRKQIIGWSVGLLAACALVLGIASKACRGTRKDAARMAAHTEVLKFEANPLDEAAAAAAAAIAALEKAGQKQEADEIRKRHAEALAGQGKKAEAELRARLEANPADDEALGNLVALLARRKDVVGAREAYAHALARAPSTRRRVTFGSWLYRNGAWAAAAKELEAALKEGSEDPYAHAYYGLALLELGRKKEARREISKALEEGADMDLLRLKDYELEQELGPEAEEPPAAPARRVKKRR